MKKGIQHWALPGYMTIPEKISFAARTGFDGIELSITDSGELTLNSPPASLIALRQTAQDAGIEILSLTCSLNWQCSLTSGEEAHRLRARENLMRQMDAAAALHCGAILALPGFVGLDFKSGDLFPDPNRQGKYFPGSEVVDYQAAYERSMGAFQSLAPYAKDRNVLLCVENIWNKFLLSPLEMRGFLDEIGSPFVKAYFDVGNVMPWGYPEHWIRALGERIARVHLKDYRRGANGLSGFVDLLSGDISFRQVRQALEEVGYDGWVTAELGAYKEYPELTAVHCLSAMEAVFGKNE